MRPPGTIGGQGAQSCESRKRLAAGSSGCWCTVRMSGTFQTPHRTFHTSTPRLLQYMPSFTPLSPLLSYAPLPSPPLPSPPLAPQQADPCLYTTDPEAINATLAVVAGDEFVDEFAVVATLCPVREGQQLLAFPPVNQEDGGGSSSHLHGHFGHLTHCEGNMADTVDLQPDVVGGARAGGGAGGGAVSVVPRRGWGGVGVADTVDLQPGVVGEGRAAKG